MIALIFSDFSGVILQKIVPFTDSQFSKVALIWFVPNDESDVGVGVAVSVGFREFVCVDEGVAVEDASSPVDPDVAVVVRVDFVSRGASGLG